MPAPRGKLLLFVFEILRADFKEAFYPSDIGRWAYSDFIINPFTKNKGRTSSVQLDEHPDGPSCLDRRVDKQIATREGNGKVRSDPPIYILHPSYTPFLWREP